MGVKQPLNAHSSFGFYVAIEMVCPNFHFIVLFGCAFLLVVEGGSKFGFIGVIAKCPKLQTLYDYL